MTTEIISAIVGAVVGGFGLRHHLALGVELRLVVAEVSGVEAHVEEEALAWRDACCCGVLWV